MILRNIRNVPPGGWRYKQEETGLDMSSDNLNDLCRKVQRHRRYKDLRRSLDLDEISLEVQRQICAKMNNSPAFCREERGFVRQPAVPQSEEFSFEEETKPEESKPEAAFQAKPKGGTQEKPKPRRKRAVKRARKKNADEK